MTKEIQSDTYTPPPVLSNSPKHDLKKSYEPLEGDCTLPNLINKLLKKPLSIIHELEMKKNAGSLVGSSWTASDEFEGATYKPKPLNAWEKYTQVLLLSNEVVYTD